MPATSDHRVGRRRLFASVLWIIWIGFINRPSPFPNLSCHIENPVGACSFRKLPDGNGLTAKAADKRQIRARHVITPGIEPAVGSTRGFFPFRFAGKPLTGPRAIGGGAVTAQLTDRVILKTFLGQPLAALIVDQGIGIRDIQIHFTLRPGGTLFLDELRVLSGANEISIDIEGWEKQFVRWRFVFWATVSAHCKFPGWDVDHSSELSPLSLHCRRGANFPRSDHAREHKQNRENY